MAKSSKQIRRSATVATGSGKHSKLGPTFDVAVFIIAVLVTALVFGLSPEARGWMVGSLAFGWVPFGLWLGGRSQSREISRKFLYSETRRRPMVIPVILEI